MDMRRALKDRLANYKIPQDMKVVGDIPKNAMGKSKSFLTRPIISGPDADVKNCTVNKKSLVKEMFGDEA